MEVDVVEKGKGKGSKNETTKGKGLDKGTAKASDKEKGQNKEQQFQGECRHCGKWGQKACECWWKKGKGKTDKGKNVDKGKHIGKGKGIHQVAGEATQEASSSSSLGAVLGNWVLSVGPDLGGARNEEYVDILLDSVCSCLWQRVCNQLPHPALTTSTHRGQEC